MFSETMKLWHDCLQYVIIDVSFGTMGFRYDLSKSSKYFLFNYFIGRCDDLGAQPYPQSLKATSTKIVDTHVLLSANKKKTFHP